MKHFKIVLTHVLWLSMVAVAAAGSDVRASDEPDMRKLAAEIARKGRQSKQELGVEPQISAIMTEKYKGKASDQIIDLLTKKHSSDSSIDAYVKLQLLSFEPKLKSADPDQLEKLLKAMPSLDAMPRSAPSGLERLKQMAEQEKLPREGLQKVTNAFNAAVGKISEGNKRSIEYRKKLISKLPSEGGLKLFGILINAYDVASNGEEVPVHHKRVKGKKVPAEGTYDMKHAAEEVGRIGSVDAGMKRKLLAALAKIRLLKGRYSFKVRSGVNKDSKVWISSRSTHGILGKDDAYYKKVLEGIK